jgi:AAA domain, putative AbiEii toxin, Type IV TA system
MRLISALCLGYKRLRSSGHMDLDSNVICIVGPNGAGKSSFLESLTHLNDDREYTPSERTRSTTTTIQVLARFVLEEDDRQALNAVPEAKGVRQFILYKKDTHGRLAETEPAIARDRGPRDDVLARLRKLRSDDWLASADGSADDPSLTVLVDNAVAAAEREDEDLPESAVDALLVLGERLKALATLPYRLRGLAARVAALTTIEAYTNPRIQAIDILRERCPQFLMFKDADRALNATYDLNGPGDPAIRNLLALAGTSYETAQALVGSGDKGHKSVFLDRANGRLREVFTHAWGQHDDLTVRLDLDASVLTVLMSMRADDYLQIDQQSDGLRQFVALRSYVGLANPVIKPILLIDEAENHLHYDAQADLVRVLEEQTEAAKVIYTTHSAGCLPRDLGTGVRAIVPTVSGPEGTGVQTDDSHVVNNFWSGGRGFSPLLIAMGASALAFAATKKAAIAEGMSDVLLLPSLLREATGKLHLDYQVTPGFAEASAEEVAEFDLTAARVAYIADGDKGGREHIKKLCRSGVPLEQIAVLGGSGSGLSLEDLITKEVYAGAINAEIARWQENLKYPADTLPEKGRGSAVDVWCKDQVGADGRAVKLSKVRVAQRLLDASRERRVVAPKHRPVLAKLDRDLITILSRPTHTLRH